MTCWSVENYFPRDLVTLLVYMRWIVGGGGKTWFLVINYKWDGKYGGIVSHNSRNPSLGIVFCE